MFSCEICDFSTTRKAHYGRHLSSDQHRKYACLMSMLSPTEDLENDRDQVGILPIQNLSEDEGGDEEIEVRVFQDCDTDGTNLPGPRDEGSESEEPGLAPDIQDDVIDGGEWYPFESKVEYLMYALMNSTTHPISEEIVKFVRFMLLELGVRNVPSIEKIKGKKFGNFNWTDLTTRGNNNNNTPIWTLKPSAMLQMLIAHPDVSKSVIRGPEESVNISHPAHADKWKRDIDFPSETEEGIPVVTLPLNLFLDDTATHRSRQWLPLHCIQMQLSGIPLKERSKNINVQFVGASEKADIMDVAKIIVDDIKDLQSVGIESYDAYKQQHCIVKSCIDTIVADFNMLSYCCNHLGATAKKYCPRCNVESEQYMTIGTKRTPHNTKLVLDRLAIQHTETAKKDLRKRTGVKEHDNVFWDSLDPHRDIPVGLLHVLPLGLTKHLIQLIVSNIQEAEKLKLAAHLESVHPGSKFHEFFNHLDSRQGKHFKEYIAPLSMAYAGIENKYIQMVSCLALIQKKLNKSSFSVADVDSLREDIRAYHQLMYIHAPQLENKVKTHLILHVVDDIKRHGPPKAYEEDAFEKNHGTIRNLIFLQNQKARSRDTSVRFAKHYIFKHVITGGYFQCGTNWIQASPEVISLGKNSAILKFLGMEDEGSNKQRVGSVSALKRDRNNHPVVEICRENLILQALPNIDVTNCSITRGEGMTASSRELIHTGDWVEYVNSDTEECYGIFKEGIVVSPKRGSSHMLAVLESARKSSEMEVGCPKYACTGRQDVIPTTNVLKKVNFLHDCRSGGCRIVQKNVTEKVEQEEVIRNKTFLKHNKQHNVYVQNVYKL